MYCVDNDNKRQEICPERAGHAAVACAALPFQLSLPSTFMSVQAADACRAGGAVGYS